MQHTNTLEMSAKHATNPYRCITRLIVTGTRHYYAAWVGSCTNFVHSARTAHSISSNTAAAFFLLLCNVCYCLPYFLDCFYNKAGGCWRRYSQTVVVCIFPDHQVLHRCSSTHTHTYSCSASLLCLSCVCVCVCVCVFVCVRAPATPRTKLLLVSAWGIEIKKVSFGESS